MPGLRRRIFTLQPFWPGGNPRAPLDAASDTAGTEASSHCYHHKRNETSNDWPRTRDWSPGCRAHCRAASCSPGAIRRLSAAIRACSIHARPYHRAAGSSATRRAGSKPVRPSGRARSISRCRRFSPPLSPRGRHSLARGHRCSLPLARNRLCPNALAFQPGLRAHHGPQNLLGIRLRRRCVLVFRHQLILARPPTPGRPVGCIDVARPHKSIQANSSPVRSDPRA
jgi:hypothetical protein